MLRAVLLSTFLIIAFFGSFLVAHLAFDYKISFYTYGDSDFLWWSTEKKLINIALGGEPKSFDPHKAFTSYEKTIVYDIFEGLMQHDSYGKSVLGLAKEYTVSSDGLTYEFKLKSGIKWSDGSDITANDFVSSYERLLNQNNDSMYAYLLYPVVGAEDYHNGKGNLTEVAIKAVDEKTLSITLIKPVQYFVDSLAHFALSVLKADNFKDVMSKPNPDLDDLLTSGGYSLANSHSQGIIIAKKNEYYYDKKNIRISTINYYITSNQNLIMKGYKAQYINLVRYFNSSYLYSLKNIFGDAVRIFPVLGVSYLAFNFEANNSKKYNVSGIRSALNMLISRDKFFQGSNNPLETTSYSLINPLSLPGYRVVNPNWKDWQDDVKSEASVNTLTDLGYSYNDPFNLQLSCIYGNEFMDISSNIIKASFEFYPIALSVDNKDCLINKRDMKSFKFDLGYETVQAEYLNPIALFNIIRYGRSGKYAGFTNKDFLERLDAAETSPIDHANSYLKYQEAEQTLVDEAAIIPLYYLYAKNVVSPNILGWADNSLDIHLTKYLYFEKTQ